MSEREFSRRLNIEIIKDEPLSRDEYVEASFGIGKDANLAVSLSAKLEQDYVQYLYRFQPYRWRAVAANGEPIAHGESYFNEADAINAANLLAGDDTTAYLMPMYGDDRSEKVLRFGATDRKSQSDLNPPF
jgi:uncharacterized protein YegP (UPF0339 family)